MVHTEVVLQCDGGECLGGCLDLHAFLGLDGLVESVAVAATFHNTACLLVNNLNLVVVNHIFDVAVEEGVGFEQLVHRVHALCLDGVVLCIGCLLLGFLFG